jgi:ADP-heptose:LPS heptosyltransferase
VVLEVLRRGDPGLEIEYLCDASHAAILADHPQLQAVHALAVRRHGSDAAARRAAAAATVGGTRGTVGTVMALRARGFDLAIDLFFNPRSAWLLWLAGIPRRIGGTGSRSRGRLYTHIALARTPAEAPQLHALAGGALADHLSRLAPLRAPDGRPFLRWLEEELRPGCWRRRRPGRPRPGPSSTGASWCNGSWRRGSGRWCSRRRVARGPTRRSPS